MDVGPAGAVPTDAVKKAFVRKRRWIWIGWSLLVGLVVLGSALVALDLRRWQRIGVAVVAPIASVSDCREAGQDGESVCLFRIVFRTEDGRLVRGELRRNESSATYADETERTLRIRYDPADPTRISTDFTDPTLPTTFAIAMAALLVYCLLRIDSGTRWLRRLDDLLLNPDAPRIRMRTVLLSATSGWAILRNRMPFAWIVDQWSTATSGLNLPLIRGQRVKASSSHEATVIGDPRPRGVVVLVVDGVPLYPSRRAGRYSYSRRVTWDRVDETF